ncbi:MAG: sugar transferase [Bacteroidetes bacterium]|nr:sugar transferase [Bacteroidota bacterium]MBS1628970.1 sugar transferase [Bacteroidota bacterium]
MILQLPNDKQSSPVSNPTTQTELGNLREMLSEINERYLVDDPSPTYLIAKRSFDILISFVIIILILSWLYPIIALLIKFSSRGPVLFIQERTGYLGLEFDCYKFRTMYLNAEANTAQATAKDPRITPIGRLLRATHLDELPQLFNVLLGDMSIVGPRPHMLYHTRYYAKMIPYYHLRHSAQPGMTGMAQIKGYIGEIHQEREIRKRIQWDIYYLKHRSGWLDFKIFFITIGQVLGKAFQLLHHPSGKTSD